MPARVMFNICLFLYLLLISFIPVIYTLKKNNKVINNAKEDAYLTTPYLLLKYGYPAEEHKVITSDRYILKVHRIPRGKKIKTSSKGVVLLNHGLFSSSADWIITGPDNALGYNLADAGYDVWMTNARGNTYSRNHVYLSNKSHEFWNFDWHEISIYDLPAVIDYILAFTNNTNLNFIGHSQGTTTFYVLTSMLPEYNEKIKLHISLAPSAFFKHIKGLIPVPRALIAFNQPLLTFLRMNGIQEYFRSSDKRTKFTNALCNQNNPMNPICFLLANTLLGSITPNKSTFIALMGHFPSGGSWKQLEHYAQIINSGHFRQYDYGWIHNRKIYHTIAPPDYDLKKITSPVVLIGAANDILATEKDIDRLEKELPNVKKRFTVSDPRFGHCDFLVGADAKDVLNNRVLEILEENG